MKRNCSVVSQYDDRPSQDGVALFSIENAQVSILCDGAGGIGDGLSSSMETINNIGSLIHKHWQDHKYKGDLIRDVLMKADYLLERSGFGETTAVVTIFENGVLVGASVGDSKAYIFEKEELRELTAGQINVRMGNGAIPVPFEVNIDNMDYAKVVIASDGLWNYASLKEVEDSVRNFDGEMAVSKAYSASAKIVQQDDFSMILMEK